MGSGCACYMVAAPLAIGAAPPACQALCPSPHPHTYPADTLHANLLEVKDEYEIKRFALFDQVRLISLVLLLVWLRRCL